MNLCRSWPLLVILLLLVPSLYMTSRCYGSVQNSTERKPLLSSVPSVGTSVPLSQSGSANMIIELPKNNPILLNPLVKNRDIESGGKTFQESNIGNLNCPCQTVS